MYLQQLLLTSAVAAGSFSRLSAASPVAGPRRQAATALKVDLTEKHQEIDGFGISEAFQRANGIVNLEEPKRTEVMDLLFNRTSGAGFTIIPVSYYTSPSPRDS